MVDDVPDWQRKEEKPEHFERMYEALEIILSMAGSKRKPEVWGGRRAVIYCQKQKHKAIIA